MQTKNRPKRGELDHEPVQIDTIFTPAPQSRKYALCQEITNALASPTIPPEISRAENRHSSRNEGALASEPASNQAKPSPVRYQPDNNVSERRKHLKEIQKTNSIRLLPACNAGVPIKQPQKCHQCVRFVSSAFPCSFQP